MTEHFRIFELKLILTNRWIFQNFYLNLNLCHDSKNRFLKRNYNRFVYL